MVDFIKPRREDITRALGNDFRIVKAFEDLFDYLDSLDFLVIPDLSDKTQSDFAYYGWNSANGGWLIQRNSITSNAYGQATINNNPSYSNISDAWEQRYNLIYV